MTKEQEMARIDLVELDKLYYDEQSITFEEYAKGIDEIEETYGVDIDTLDIK